MKKYIVLLFLLCIPLNLSAHLLITTKCELIVKAEKHRKKAIDELGLLEDKCWYIPDLAKREHLKVLIATAISTIPLKDPQGSLLASGLALIASLASDMYEEYCDMRTLLASASNHLELEIFYNQLSLEFNATCKRDPWKGIQDLGTLSFLSAIDCLTMAEMLTSCIEDNWLRISISEELIHQRRILLNQLNNAPAKLTKRLSEQGWTLYENIDEILSECLDNTLKEEISGFIENMVWALENAEEKWGIS